MELLGITTTQVDKLIGMLLQEQYIDYEDSLLKITPKGMTFLIANNCGSIKTENPSNALCYISVEKAKSFDEPYVPIKFLKKYKK